MTIAPDRIPMLLADYIALPERLIEFFGEPDVDDDLYENYADNVRWLLRCVREVVLEDARLRDTPGMAEATRTLRAMAPKIEGAFDADLGPLFEMLEVSHGT